MRHRPKPDDKQPMRILVINPNMTQDITARVVKAAQPFLPMGVELVGVTGRFGSPYIT